MVGLPSAQSHHKNQGNKFAYIRGILLFFLFIPIVLVLIGILLERVPRYISLPFHPPEYFTDGEAGDWKSVVYSTFEIPVLPPIRGRVFILRKEAVVLEKNATRSSILSYFDNKLNGSGWILSDSYAPCNLYLPETEFLGEGENGVVHYRRKNYHPMYEFEESDLACLAVWKPEGVSHYNIVLITARPSLLVLLSDILG